MVPRKMELRLMMALTTRVSHSPAGSREASRARVEATKNAGHGDDAGEEYWEGRGASWPFVGVWCEVQC